MIKEAYCSYEIAKLLREKGFDEECFGAYTETNHNITMFTGLIKNSEYGNAMYTAPTHQMAMAWLRETYGIDIIIEITNPSVKNRRYYCMIWDRNSNSYILDLFNSYEDAVEAALKYALENLI
jgi:hypothetical protein